MAQPNPNIMEELRKTFAAIKRFEFYLASSAEIDFCPKQMLMAEKKIPKIA
jgi:hypothetical protein